MTFVVINKIKDHSLKKTRLILINEYDYFLF